MKKADNGLHFILEMKGYDPREEIKAAAAQRWVDAVNAEGSVGAKLSERFSPAIGSIGRWEKGLLDRGFPDPLYEKWIETYGGEESKVAEHFHTTRFEWMFWDMGYRKETWPV